MAPDFHDAEVLMMDSIRKRHGATIAAAVAGSSVRPEFLAALCGNESSGDERAVRFEPAVFGKILEVCAGKRAEYKPAGIKVPLGALDITVSLPIPFSEALPRIVTLATSHGLTQIMGWHCLEFGRDFGILATPAGQLRFTIELLAWFAHLYNLDLGTDDEALLRCWNTGNPAGLTYDSRYVPKALQRAAIYKQLIENLQGIVQ